jgi:hypothetical protein
MAIIDNFGGAEQSMVTLGCVLCGKTTEPMPFTSAFFPNSGLLPPLGAAVDQRRKDDI